MIDCKYYVNVGRLMGILPRPTPKRECMLNDDRVEQLNQLPIIHVTCIDGDYHDNDTEGIYQ